MEYLLEKWEIVKKLIFLKISGKFCAARDPPEKVLDPRIKSYEAFSIFRTSVILELVIYNDQIYHIWVYFESEFHDTYIWLLYITSSRIADVLKIENAS